MIEIIDDELNPRRNNPAVNIEAPAYERAINQESIEAAVTYAWNAQRSKEDSPISRNMKGILGRITKCNYCAGETRTFELFTYLTINIPDDNRPYSLRELFDLEYGRGEPIDGYTCDSLCKKTGQTASRTTYLCYLPDYLVIQLNRYNAMMQRVPNTVTFPEKDLDLSRACVPPGQISQAADRRLRGPFVYDTYAVTMHKGNTIKSGHYLTFARSLDKPTHVGSAYGAGQWHLFNDRTVRPAHFVDTQCSSQSPNGLATVIFLKRKGQPAV